MLKSTASDFGRWLASHGVYRKLVVGAKPDDGNREQDRMVATIKVAISIQKTVFDQAEALRRQFNIPRHRFLGMAIEHFIKNYESPILLDEMEELSKRVNAGRQDASVEAVQIGSERKEIRRGDVYWIPLDNVDEAGPDYAHPHVVIQENVLNRSRIHTVVVCALTTNMRRAKAPGNVLLEVGEANLSKQSIVVVSQVSVVDKTQIGEYIGSLSEQRVDQILAGMQFLQSMTAFRQPGDMQE